MSQEKAFAGGSHLYFEKEMQMDQLVAVVRNRLNRISPQLKFILVIGPVRTGTTVMQILMTQLPSVLCSEFQPFKYILRQGVEVSSFFYDPFPVTDQQCTVVIKETMGPLRPMECVLDPVEILIRAGVAAERISAVYMLREPFYTFYSWNKFQECPLEGFVITHKIFHTYFQRDQKRLSLCLPFCYEVLANDPARMFRLLFSRLGLIGTDVEPSLEFQPELLLNKVLWDEAEDHYYWEHVVQPMVSRGAFQYTVNGDMTPLSAANKALIEPLLPQFQDWLQLVRKTFFPAM